MIPKGEWKEFAILGAALLFVVLSMVALAIVSWEF